VLDALAAGDPDAAAAAVQALLAQALADLRTLRATAHPTAPQP
jgi:DNA-binding GntR family transcriptional regulator